jgi:hypothetical protein
LLLIPEALLTISEATMVQLTSLLAVVPLLLLQSFISAAALKPRQTAATQVVKITSIENLAVRSNGQILATNMNSANLYTVDPVAKTSSTAVVLTGASGLSGIGEVTPDIFAVIGERGSIKLISRGARRRQH